MGAIADRLLALRLWRTRRRLDRITARLRADNERWARAHLDDPDRVVADLAQLIVQTQTRRSP